MATGTSYSEAQPAVQVVEERVAPRPTSLFAHWRTWLSLSPARFIIAAAAVLLTTPSLRAGLIADDLFHQLMLRKVPGVPGLSYRPLDLFRFATGDTASNHALMDSGVFPWWADPRAL